MKFALDDNKGLGVVLFTLILAAVVFPLSTLQVARAFSHVAPLPGVPVNETMFADIVGVSPDPVIFPEGTLNASQHSIRMRVDYSGLSKVNFSIAIEAANNFMLRIPYLTEMNLTIDPIWTNLDSAVWSLRFSGNRVNVYIGVNGLSGKVMSFASYWQGRSPFDRNLNETKLLSNTEVEDKALQFLQVNNYSLSRHARYDGPLLDNCRGLLSYQVFSLKFVNVIDDIVVSPSHLTMGLDIETGEILRFTYHWTHIETIPTDNIISADVAEWAAISHLVETRNAPGISVMSTVLIFKEYLQHGSYEFRLCWVVFTDYPEGYIVIVDAVSEEPFDEGENAYADVSSPISSSIASYCMVWAFLGSFIVAIIAYIGAKWFAWKVR